MMLVKMLARVKRGFAKVCVRECVRTPYRFRASATHRTTLGVIVAVLLAACGDGPTEPQVSASLSRLSVGNQTVCALNTAGALYCWGFNSSLLEFGVSPDAQATTATPVQVTSAPTFAGLSVGAAQHMCGVARNSVAHCWGRGAFGEMGNGATTSNGNTFTQVLGTSWASLAVGRLTACGVTTRGNGLCWGSNQRGEIGAVTVPINAITPTPTLVDGQHSFKQIVTGWKHGCGITSTDNVVCWGENAAGQLGNGIIDDPSGAVDTHRSPAPIASSEKFLSLSAGALQTCGVTLDHRALCWGKNDTGQLGDGTIVTRATPTLVAGGQKFTSISVASGFGGGATVAVPPNAAIAASGHTCALTEAGAAFCWGWNGDGQVGDGTRIDRTTPAAVAGGLTFTTIGAGGAATCAMRGNAVWCWGAGTSGQLGQGAFANSSTPISVGAPFSTP